MTAPTTAQPAGSRPRGPLVAADITSIGGFLYTPARTLVDLAHEIGERDLTRALREAQFRRLVHLPSMLAVLDHRRSKALRELLTDLAPTQSHLEDRLMDLCRRHGLPAPLTQQHVAGRRVDFLWPAERVVVEADGYQAHTTAAAFQLDRTTTNDLQLAGYTTLRSTYADVTRRPARVAGQIHRALAR